MADDICSYIPGLRIPNSLFHRRRRGTACSSPDCAPHSVWHQLTGRGSTVELQDSAFCFPLCFERELRQMLQTKLVSVTESTPLRWRIPLGLLLLSRGAITEFELQRALNAQKLAGKGRLGHWLQEMKLAGEEEVFAALAMQWACPVLKRFPSQFPEHKIPLRLMECLRMVPVHFANANRVLHIAFAGDVDYPALVCIERMLQIKTEACLANKSLIEGALRAIRQAGQIPEKLFENCRENEEIVRIISSYAAELGATEVRAESCHELFWVKILGHHSADLLFSRKDCLPAVN
jgi:hypothetical protein